MMERHFHFSTHARVKQPAADMGHARVILCYDIFLVICTFTVIVANSLGEHWQTTMEGNLKEIVPFALFLAFSSKQTLCCHIS